MEIARSTYVLIEGTDMAGKTTTADKFISGRSNEWGLRRNSLLDTPNPLQYMADQMVESGEFNKTTINLTYAASILMDIDMFAWPGVDTVQESVNVIRSIGHAHVNNDREVEKILLKSLGRFPEFDRAFFLTADRETRLARLAMRTAKSANDKLIIKDPKKFFAVDDVARNIAVDKFGAQIIDTTKLTHEEVQEVIAQEVVATQKQR